MNNELYVSSKGKNEYPIYLTKEELEAIPVILQMAEIYTWELYNKTENDKFYKQHKENINKIDEYHNKGYQGILAVGSFISDKAGLALKNENLNEILESFMNKEGE